MEDYIKDLSTILGIEASDLQDLEEVMSQKTGHTGVLKKIFEKNQRLIKNVLDSFGVEDPDAESVSFLLRQA